MNALGKRPELRWIDKRLLQVEPEYQRELSQRRSQALITKLADGYCYAHGSVLIVAKAADDRWTIIDGQHRHTAAMKRNDIKDLPCLIVDANSIEARARAFVAHNRDRVTLNFLALFHADVAAGDANARAVVDACAKAGIAIPRSPKTVAFMKTNETMAVGALVAIVRDRGEAELVRILTLLKRAYPDRPGQLRSNLIKAVAEMVRRQVAPDRIVETLGATDAQQLEDQARAQRAQGQSIVQSYIKVVAKACGADAPPKPRAEAKAPPAKARKPFRFDRSKPAPPPGQTRRGPRQRSGAPVRDGRVRPRQRRLPEALRLRGQQAAEWLRREEGRRARQAEAHDPRAGDRVAQSRAQEARSPAGHQG